MLKRCISEEIPWPVTRLYDKYANRLFVKWFRLIARNIAEKGISGTILDIGTGPGRLPLEIAKRLDKVKVIGIDLSEDMVKIAKKNAEKEGLTDRVEFRVGSAYKTGFADCSIDLIVSTGVVHHLKEPLRFFNEIYRILKNGKEAWLYDGRRDANKQELREAVQILGMEEDLFLPLWFVGYIWSHIHLGYKTEVYRSGKIAEALRESLFKNYEVIPENAYLRMILRKK